MVPLYGKQDFAIMAESIFGNSPRRSDLEKWYARLISSIFEGVVRLSNEGGKTPAEVIRMENFHRLHAILSRLKVQYLEQQKKDAKIKYNESLNAYVTKYFGRPLEKLNVRLPFITSFSKKNQKADISQFFQWFW